jgi:hypothetical protein
MYASDKTQPSRLQRNSLIAVLALGVLSGCVQPQGGAALRITEVPEWDAYVQCLQQSSQRYGTNAPLADASVLAANACQAQAAILADVWGRSRGLTRSGRLELRSMLFDQGVSIAADFITSE